MTHAKKELPECTIGRTGRDLFSSRKELTVILIPYERFSPFAEAVDDLYKTMDVPFNLIVVEGNAPESVRSSLEKRQKKHKNLTIIYSERQVSMGAAINLAAPHLKTKYAFIMDNDVRLSAGTMGRLLQYSKNNDCGIVYPQNDALLPGHSENSKKDRRIARFGIRICLLIAQEALGKMGKLNENVTPFTAGIDIRITAEESGIRIGREISARVKLDNLSPLWPMDAVLHSFQWDKTRIQDSFRCLKEKWGICLPEENYAGWIERKRRDLADSKNILFFLASLAPKFKFWSTEKV